MTEKIFILADKTDTAQDLTKNLIEKHPDILIKNIDKAEDISAILVLGGDGFMLHSIHKYMDFNIPFYGLNCGSLGFLLNNFTEMKT